MDRNKAQAAISRPVRVLRVIARLNVGGPVRQISSFSPILGSLQIDETLVIGKVGKHEKVSPLISRINAPIVHVPSLRPEVNPLRDFQALLVLRRIIKEGKPDVVHTHTFKAGLLGRVACFTINNRPRIVHSFHGHLLHGNFSRLKTQLIVAIERWLARGTDALVTVGVSVRDDLLGVKVGREEQYWVTAPGVEITRGNKLPRSSDDDKDRSLVVALVARVTHVKRPDRFLDVVRLVQKSGGGVRFLLAGDGELLETTRDVARVERLPITFLGWVDHMERVYEAADVLLLTSDNEGTPIAIIEAGLFGIPAIATNVGSVDEVIEDGRTGWLSDPSAEELSKVILNVRDNRELLSEYGKRAATRAADKFGSERLARELSAIYRHLLSTNTSD